MPDDKQRNDVPDEPDYDDDVPFKLPKADHIAGNIHKEDTDEIDIPENPFAVERPFVVDSTAQNRPETTDEINALHAADPPLTRMDDDDSIAETLPREMQTGDVPFVEDSRDLDDSDVPFKLPKSGNEKSEDAPLPNKYVTMPNQKAVRGADMTLPGSGGLDPNPDFLKHQQPQSNATMQHQRVAPQDAARYSRPVQQPSQQSPMPQRSALPPAPPSGKNAVNPKQRGLPKRKKRRFNPGCVAIFIGILVTFCGGMTLVTGVAGVFAYARVGDLLNEAIDPIEDYTNFQSTFLYDRNGVQLYEVFGEGRRTNVSITEMPDFLIDATIAIEDDSFYQNIGIDIPATSVALMSFLGASADENTAGGSTITQQLVRNVLFDYEYRAERSAQRKAEEIMLAIALTQRLSKDEILEMYLNEIYYGNLAYGAEAASQVFFGKSVTDLTLGEAALLAGLPQSPANLDPLSADPTVQSAVQVRWLQVLDEMVYDGSITQADRDQALTEGLRFNPQDVPLRSPHFTVYAQNELEALMGELGYSPEQIANGGLQVYTTVDTRIDEQARQIAAEQVASARGNNVSNAAVVILNPTTGEILGMVGSVDYNSNAIDGRFNVTTGLRQPGSTMKPFTYSAALEMGMTPGDVIWDTRISIDQPGQAPYVPRNYDGTFHGPVRIRQALANSYNIPAVQTLRRIGVQPLLDIMARFGVDSLGQDASFYGLSLTLGGGDISPLELSRAYGVFANQGSLVDSHAILCVLDNDDNIIYQYENGCPRGNVTSETVARTGLGTQVLDPRIAFYISDVMADNSSNGRAPAMGTTSALFTPNITTSVKTGTTNDVKDNWTVGYSHNVVIGVWVGNNNGDPLVNSSGLTGAAPIWNRVMTMIYENQSYLGEFAVDGQLRTDQLQPPPGMTLQRICDVRALQDPAASCGARVNEWFLDSPAGLPDGNGGLYYPTANNQVQPIPQTGAIVQEAEPGVYRSVVLRLDPNFAAGISFNVAPGQLQPPTPLYCRVPAELIASTPGAAEQLFIAPPPVQADAVEAEQYARARGLAFLPTIDCSPEIIGGGAGYSPNVVTAVITSPAPGSTITQATPIIGTVQFTPQQAQFYKLDIVGGQFANWTSIGEIHYNSVVNGQLEILPGPPGLQPGNYRLRLVVVGLDSNHLQQPYEIPFTVSG
ncbi:MAG: transglycosylase domain-containing protein [Aggregatilineales bacterium]